MTAIEWTHRPGTTGEKWNPVTGCTKVSAGCKYCYAETVANRFWATQYPTCGAIADGRKFTDVWTHPERLALPLSWKKPRTVFVDSMGDLFHQAVPNAFIYRTFAVMQMARQHTFVVLTKRPKRMLALLADARTPDEIDCAALELLNKQEVSSRVDGVPCLVNPNAPGGLHGWPLQNVWPGVSIEDQPTADERIPLLLQTPAAVRLVSVEPLLGPVDLTPWLPDEWSGVANCDPDPTYGDTSIIDWVIVGGESGPKARPCDVAWIRSIVRQCAAAGTPCFVKQIGASSFDGSEVVGQFDTFQQWVNKARSWLGGVSGGGLKYKQPERAICVDTLGRICANGGDFMRARDESAFPVRWTAVKGLKDRKGSDPSEWPPDLRVRQWPEVKR